MALSTLQIAGTRAKRNWWLALVIAAIYGLEYVLAHLIEHRIFAWANEIITEHGWLDSVLHYLLSNPLLIAIGLPLTIFVCLLVYDYRQRNMGAPLKGKKCVDWEHTKKGEAIVGEGDLTFSVHFSGRSHSSVYLYKVEPPVTAVARIRDAQAGTTIRFHETPDETQALWLNEHAILKNQKGYFMQLRLLSIDQQRNTACFAYEIDPASRSEFKAL